jgi:hypothetical protein
MTKMRQCCNADLGDNNEPELEITVALVKTRKTDREKNLL